MIHSTLPNNLAHLREVMQSNVANARTTLGTNSVVILATETHGCGAYKYGAITRDEMLEYLAAWAPTDSAAVCRIQLAPYGQPLGVVVPQDGNDMYIIALKAGVMVS
jgi:hypothetical protein